MDKGLLAIICIVVALFGFFVIAYIQEEQQKQTAINISLEELVLNKSVYEGKYVRVNGTLTECIQQDYHIWYIFIPITYSDGKHTWTSFILIPVIDKYYVYAVTDGNYTIAMLSEINLEQHLGKQVTIVGKVDGVKNRNGETLDYVINTSIVK